MYFWFLQKRAPVRNSGQPVCIKLIDNFIVGFMDATKLVEHVKPGFWERGLNYAKHIIEVSTL